ncbi:ABC transporter ATP-binding protein [Arthrobacter sp. Sr24]
MSNFPVNVVSASTERPDQIVLSLDRVSVSFGVGDRAIPVTQEVSLNLHRGETLALVGESGSGKSVTAMAMLGLLPGNAHATGSIKFGETEMIGASEATLREVRGSRIGVIFQEPMTALNPVYKIGTLIGQALQSQRKRPAAEARARALELLKLVGMPDPERRIDCYSHQLSGGQRQRAMIAMAISGDPEILIADEPTTALDVTVQADILALLKSLQTSMGMAMIFITHDMGVVAEVADRVCVMRSGSVIEHSDVFALFVAPKEPYTRQLLAAVPRLGVGAPIANSLTESDSKHPVVLKVRNLEVRYPGQFRTPGFLAVNGVSIDVEQGEIVGLVGESGSGKSTIGRAILGLTAVSSGAVSLDGTNLADLHGPAARKARRALSIVFQDPASSLNPRATIGQSIVEPLARYGIVRGRSALRTRAETLLDQVQLPKAWASRFPHELSGGQRQRVGIARAISMEPRLLVADEPTSALDVSVQAAVLKLFQELQRELGFSCLFISHDLAVVEMLAKRVVVLRQGAVVESGPAHQILTHPAEDYTRRLVAAAPIPDPLVQKERAALRLV